MSRPSFVRGIVERLPDCEEIMGGYVARRDWRADVNGYFLIRVNRREGLLEAAFCPEVNKIAFIFRGKRPEDIYHEAARRKLLTKPDHYAYLGLELEKAYLAMTHALKYVQDDDLDLVSLKTRAKIRT